MKSSKLKCVSRAPPSGETIGDADCDTPSLPPASCKTPGRGASDPSAGAAVGIAPLLHRLRHLFRHVKGGRPGSLAATDVQRWPRSRTPSRRIWSSSGVQSKRRFLASGARMSLCLLEHWSSFLPGISLAISFHAGPSLEYASRRMRSSSLVHRPLRSDGSRE